MGGWLTNSSPVITSTPSPTAVVGRLYLYQMDVSDVDRDELSFVLLQGPAGMSIHPKHGTVAWTPAFDQLGSASVLFKYMTPWAQPRLSPSPFELVGLEDHLSSLR